ncbi:MULTISPECIES: fluoride efflux transporter CrcB [unclassified Agromyces]|uniref:fluoride efflux transporter CrcB n=1 Tax=unclassified Agromyces TaxID=2639701 RepID=UPI003014A924
MTVVLFLATAVAGGIGAALRFAVDVAVGRRAGAGFPFGTVLVNVTGSFALGTVAGVAANGWLPPEVATVVGVGLLGGYTTFSTASMQTVRLVQEGRYRAALVNGLGALVACTLAALLGLGLGALLGGLGA